MSTPNEPEGSQRSGAGTTDRPETGDGGGDLANGRGDDAARPGSNSGQGGKPPWQRVGAPRPGQQGGPVQPNQGSNPAGPAQGGPGQGGAPYGGQQPGPGQNPSGPYGGPPQAYSNGAPHRPLVTGSAAPPQGPSHQGPPQQPQSSDAATTRAPINKLDADGNVARDGRPDGVRDGAPDATKGRNSLTGKVIDGPTRTIDRNNVPEDLPDLDAIHHPSAGQPAADSASAPMRPVETYSAGPRGPLRASVQLRRIDPWSTFKISSVLAIALFLIWMIAIGVLYVILDGMGVWDQLNSSFGTLVSSDSATETSLEITAGGVFGIAALVGAVYVVVFTALTTVGAFIYNMSADLVGGVEVTLADRD